MTEHLDESATTTHRRRPALIAVGLAVLIIAVVAVVLILAGGEKTSDGTGRDRQASVTATTNITNTTGGPADGSDR